MQKRAYEKKEVVHLTDTDHINKYKQESPPAWTQEAYRPSRNKCSPCCFVSWWGVPHPVLMGGAPGWPDGVPPLGRIGYPCWEGWRYTPIRKDGGTPPVRMYGVLPRLPKGLPPNNGGQSENITLRHPSDADIQKLQLAPKRCVMFVSWGTYFRIIVTCFLNSAHQFSFPFKVFANYHLITLQNFCASFIHLWS